jgi:hypothetical protein
MFKDIKNQLLYFFYYINKNKALILGIFMILVFQSNYSYINHTLGLKIINILNIVEISLNPIIHFIIYPVVLFFSFCMINYVHFYSVFCTFLFNISIAGYYGHYFVLFKNIIDFITFCIIVKLVNIVLYSWYVIITFLIFLYNYLYILENNYELFTSLNLMLKIQHLNIDQGQELINGLNNINANLALNNFHIASIFKKNIYNNLSIAYLDINSINSYNNFLLKSFYNSMQLIEFINTEINPLIQMNNTFYNKPSYVLNIDLDSYIHPELKEYSIVFTRETLGCCYLRFYINNFNNFGTFNTQFYNITDISLLICSKCLSREELDINDIDNYDILHLIYEKGFIPLTKDKGVGEIFTNLVNFGHTIGFKHVNMRLNVPKRDMYSFILKSVKILEFLRENSYFFGDILTREYRKKVSPLGRICRKIFNNLPVDVWFRAITIYIKRWLGL